MACIDGTTPSKKFLKTVSQTKFSHVNTSRIAQLRLGHAPINKYLKCMRQVDSTRCPACGDDEETLEHFLLHCPSYAHKIWALAQWASKLLKALMIETLLGEPEMARTLAKYIRATNQFR